MPALRNRDRSNSIVSPTPRPFSFPTTHNLNTLDDSPPSSPSSSPFEPELLSVTNQRPITPPSSPPPPSSPTRANKPIPSVGSLPKKGDANYIKRPENAFILFRRKCVEERSQPIDVSDDKKKPRQADLSKSISQQWKSLSKVERQYWEDLAKEKKKEHEALYPGYVYRPQRARDKDGNVKPRRPRGSRIKEKLEKAARDADMDAVARRASEDCSPTPQPPAASLSIVIPSNNRHPRSLSLPTPHASNQIIEIPTVYHASSCPNTPTRDCAPGHEYVKGTSTMSDEIVDWTSMKGDGLMPWSQPTSFTWNQPQFYTSDGEIPLQPSFFPLEPDFSFTNTTLPSPSPQLLAPFNYSSETTTCDPLSSFPTFDFEGVDPSFKFHVPADVNLSQSLAHASMVWEQANPVWGGNSQLEFDMWNQPQQEQENGGWGLDAIPSMQLSLPSADGDATPTANSTRGSLSL